MELRQFKYFLSIVDSGIHRTLGLCVSAHLPLTSAKRAIGSVIGDLCDQGQWAGARRASSKIKT